MEGQAPAALVIGVGAAGTAQVGAPSPAEYSADVASAGSNDPVSNAVRASQVTAILLDAGGVLVFPEPDRLLPLLRGAGVAPDLATLERAHYRAMAIQDAEASPPVQASWWRNYLLGYVAACGVGQDRAELLATEMAQGIRGHGWTHVGLGAMDGLRAVAALGLPMGVVSNSDGSVEGDLRRLGVCYVPDASDGPGTPAAGVPMGVILDSAVVGVAKPDPGSSASRSMRWACLPVAPSCTSGTACATTWPAPSRRACSRSTWTRTGSARRPTATRTSAASPS